MAEIEPEHIDAGLEESADPFGGRTRWTERRNDLGTAPAPDVGHSRPISVEHEDGSEIVDIGQCRTGHDKIAQSGKKFISVIIGEQILD
jgi:hypothetical protein